MAQVKRQWAIEPKPEDLKLIEQCRWKEPAHGYVLFKVRKARILREGEPEEEGDYERLRPMLDLSCWNIDGCHKQPHKLQRFMTLKKAEIVTWGKFPSPNNKQAKILRDGDLDKTPWEILEDWLNQKLEERGAAVAERDAFESKIAEQQRLIAEQTAELNQLKGSHVDKSKRQSA